MKPAASILLFTTIAGAAQGLVVALALAFLVAGAPRGLAMMLWVAAAMLVAALVASFFHLGHPMRAWRAALMWRTSWMSREVIVLPAFIAVVGAWALLETAMPQERGAARLLACASIVLALVLWYCTAMIYACIRFIREWAHPLTIVNYLTLGLASGLVACGALAFIAGDAALARGVGPWALAMTALAWFTRSLSLRRNAGLKPKSTVQSATGIRAGRVVQIAMGMTGGSFNTREFFHGASANVYRSIRPAFQLLAFAIPLVLVGTSIATGAAALWVLASVSQMIGMLAERWFFFAQAQHPQNIYYQSVA